MVEPSDPIATLMEEHRRFLERLESFRDELRGVRAGAVAPADAPRRVAAFAGFLEEDVDRLHGRKEEAGLFPVLERHLPVEGGPVEVMLTEHESLREHQRSLARGAEKLQGEPSAIEIISSIDTAFGAVRGLLSDHIAKEDQVLFPMARELLSADEMLEVSEIFQRVEEEALAKRSDRASS